MSFKWSDQQTAVFDEVTSYKPGSNLLVQARAGAAKTTTIVEAARRLPAGLPTYMVAFNKHIASELRNRVPENVRVDTLHGLGLRWIRKIYGNVEVSRDKGISDARIVAAAWKRKNPRPPNVLGSKDGFVIFDSRRIYNRLPWDVKTLMGLIKVTQPTSPQQVPELARAAGLDSPIISAESYAQMAIEACQRSVRNTEFVDFDDMIYFPRKLLAPRGLWGDFAYNVFIDEAQDLSNGQRFLATAVLTQSGNGRVFAVGDDRQGLYSWRGAGANAMADMDRHLNPVRLPLSITYRCPVAVVDHVKKEVSGIDDLQTPVGTPDGLVDYRSLTFMLGPFGARAGDFVLSRLNGPLIGLAAHFAANGVKVSVMGRDLKSKLTKLVQEAKQPTNKDLENWLRSRRSSETKRLEAIGQLDTLREVYDETAALLGVIPYCDTPEDVVGYIADLFDDEPDENTLVLSTIHRAKGHERDRVWLLRQTIQRGTTKEEENCYYVGATRAKKELYLVDLERGESGVSGDLRHGELRIDASKLSFPTMAGGV